MQIKKTALAACLVLSAASTLSFGAQEETVEVIDPQSVGSQFVCPISSSGAGASFGPAMMMQWMGSFYNAFFDEMNSFSQSCRNGFKT